MPAIHKVKNENDFESQLDAAGDTLVAAMFYTPNCPFVRMITHDYAEIAKKFENRVFLKVDLNESECKDIFFKLMNDIYLGHVSFIFIKNKDKVEYVVGSIIWLREYIPKFLTDSDEDTVTFGMTKVKL